MQQVLNNSGVVSINFRVKEHSTYKDICNTAPNLHWQKYTMNKHRTQSTPHENPKRHFFFLTKKKYLLLRIYK